jgi:hypothetical protein
MGPQEIKREMSIRICFIDTYDRIGKVEVHPLNEAKQLFCHLTELNNYCPSKRSLGSTPRALAIFTIMTRVMLR